MPPGWEAQDARSPEHLLQDFEARYVDASAAVAARPGPAPHRRALVRVGPGRNAILRSVVAAFDPNVPLDDDSLRTGSGSEQSLEERGSPSPSGPRPRVPASTQLKIGLCRRPRSLMQGQGLGGRRNHSHGRGAAGAGRPVAVVAGEPNDQPAPEHERARQPAQAAHHALSVTRPCPPLCRYELAATMADRRLPALLSFSRARPAALLPCCPALTRTPGHEQGDLGCPGMMMRKLLMYRKKKSSTRSSR